MNLLTKLPKTHRIGVLTLLVFIAVLFLLPFILPIKYSEQTDPNVSALAQNQAIPLTILMENIKPLENWSTFNLKENQSIEELLQSNGLQEYDVIELILADRSNNSLLANLPDGQEIRVKLSEDNTILAVDIILPDQQQAFFIRQPDGTFLSL